MAHAEEDPRDREYPISICGVGEHGGVMRVVQSDLADPELLARQVSRLSGPRLVVCISPARAELGKPCRDKITPADLEDPKRLTSKIESLLEYVRTGKAFGTISRERLRFDELNRSA